LSVNNSNPEQRFKAELEIFRKEAESAAQFFYAYLAIDETAKDSVQNIIEFRASRIWR